METARFIHLREIFDEAVSLPASEWETFLNKACSGDENLRAEARNLLIAYQQGTTEETNGTTPAGVVRMIGPYRVLRELGSGGMGTVYLAVRDDGTFRKNVAIKLLKSKHATQDFIQRFYQERQVLANLDHPNIARILDGGQTPEGLPYHVMEYVDGLALDRYCDTQQLDLADRIRLFLQVVSAVSYLHDNLVIHRDLKPSNILVTSEGQVKLLDFGIARVQMPVSQAPDLTGPANRLLTPSYASPEQIGGAPIAKASDIYSLGVILYELLTGRLPYKDAAAKLTEEPPAPSANIREDLQRTPETTVQLRRRIVGDLDQIVLLCLRRDPRRRYASAGALAEDLSRFLEGRSVLARKEPLAERTWRFLKRKRVSVAVCTLVLALCGFGVWQTARARMADSREADMKHVLDALEHQPSTPAGDSSSKRVNDVRKLRGALEKDLSKAPSELTVTRKQLLERAARYLDSVRSYDSGDAVLAVEVAGAYQQLGVLYEPIKRDYALLAYRSAAQALEQAAGGDPSHGANRAQWAMIAGRIISLGGTIPVLVPAGPVPKPAPEISREIEPPLQDTDVETVPEPPATVQPTPDPAEYELVRKKLETAAGRSKVADNVFNELKDNVERSGQQLNPEIVANNTHMHDALDSARKALVRGDLPAARENVDIASEYARRVMNLVGR